jgi:predicted XRE-type DNA-binding protein
MDKALEKALKAAGWNVGDAADLLGMTDEQRQLLDLRMEMAKAIRTRRAEMKLSQKHLAGRLKSTQSRVSLIEAADPDVSLDQLAKALIILGGKIAIVTGKSTKPRAKRRAVKKSTVARRGTGTGKFEKTKVAAVV